MSDDVDVAALYRRPPEEFVSTRESLVKELRAAKRRDEATMVHALARPSVAAWAANRVAQADPDAVSRLVGAGAALLAAQRAAIEHGDASGVRGAQADRRSQVRTLADWAVEFLRADGRNGEGQRNALVEIFEAVSVDAASAAELTAGRLAKRPEATSGFDLLGAGLEIGTAPAVAPPAVAPPAVAPPVVAALHSRAAPEADASAERAAAVNEAQEALAAAVADLEVAKSELEAATAASSAAEIEAVAASEAVAELQRRLAEATALAARLAAAAEQSGERAAVADRANAAATERVVAGRSRLDQVNQDP